MLLKGLQKITDRIVNHFKSSLHSLNSLNTVLCNEVSQIQRNKTVFKFYSGLFLTPDFFFFFLRKGTEFGIELVVSRKLLFQLSLLELSYQRSNTLLMFVNKQLNHTDRLHDLSEKLWTFTLKKKCLRSMFEASKKYVANFNQGCYQI